MGAPIIFHQITMLLIISCLISLEIISFIIKIKETRQTAFDMVGYLSSSEVTNLLSGFETTSFWDEALARDTETAAKSFLTQIEQLGESLVKASGSFETIDTDSAEDFNNLLADVKQTWRGKNVSPNG